MLCLERGITVSNLAALQSALIEGAQQAHTARESAELHAKVNQQYHQHQHNTGILPGHREQQPARRIDQLVVDPSRDVSKALQFARQALAMDLPVPDKLADEVDLFNQVRRPVDSAARTELLGAVADVNAVEAAGWEKSVAKLRKVILADLAEERLQQSLLAITDSRLLNAVHAALPSIERGVVDQMNAVVAEHRLNDYRVALQGVLLKPDASALDFTRAETDALHAWADASSILHSLWKFFADLARFSGDPVTSGGPDEISTNLVTACTLGVPATFGQARAAAVEIAEIGMSAGGAAKYRKLGLFAVPVLAGYDLDVATRSQGYDRRTALQHR